MIQHPNQSHGGEMRNMGGGGSKKSVGGSETARRATGMKMKRLGNVSEWQR
jgi:hypothetical protein